MQIKVTITDDEGITHKRSGAIINWQEFTNPDSKKAYGWQVHLIFNDFQPPVVKPQPVKDPNV